jgi:hypothetical protein
MGLICYRKSSMTKRVQDPRSDSGPTKERWEVTGFDGLVRCLFLSCAFTLAILGAVLLTMAIAVILHYGHANLSSPSAFPLQHHHSRSHRELQGFVGKARHQGQLRSTQWRIWDYVMEICSIWEARADSLERQAEGLGQMIHFRGTRGKLGKRRILRLPHARFSLNGDELEQDRHHHLYHLHRFHYHRCHHSKQNHPKSRQIQLATTSKSHQHFSTMNQSITSGESSSPPTTPGATTTTIRSYLGLMPRPGQAGMAVFEGKEVSTFIKNWEMDCEEYGLTEIQKCKKFPRYCTKEIGEAVEKLRGYDEGNWELFKRELKQLFWQDDPPKNSIAALVKLIGEAKAGKMTVDMYVLRYTTITQELVDKNAISTFDRNVRLLEGLSEAIQSKVFEHCSDKKWRMLEHDVDTEEPKFEELREVVLAKARAVERKNLFLSGRLSGLGYPSTEAATTSTPTASTAPSTIPTAVTSPSSTASDLKELTEQISRLTLLIGGQSRQVPSTVAAPIPSVGLTPQRPTWVP